ncbi:MAG: hypothetical protein MZW92_40500 [Comamonadaceae bacterium]|nr:hypothetical protein [Comamonadaceae bacterium]
MTRITRRLAMASVALTLLLSAAGVTARVTQAQARITSPEKFFGFQMGADRKLVALGQGGRVLPGCSRSESGGKLKVVDMGPTEMGNPFLLVIITSPANQARLERAAADEPHAQRPARRARGRDQADRGRGQGGHLPDDEHARQRGGRHATWRRS